MGKITKIKTANRDEWKALRSGYIGGSDAAAVVGLNVFSSPYSLWAEKTGKTQGFAGNLATEVGTYLEEFVAQKFAAETGEKVRRENQSYLNSDYPWAIANIDRAIVGEDSGLEIKTTSEMNLKKFKGGEYPANYYCQMVHYMAVTGKNRWYLAVLIGNREFRIFTVERDEEEIAALMQAEKEFWNYVQTQTPPPADGMSATSDAIATIYAESSGRQIDLFPCHAELADYISIGKKIKELEAQRNEAANKIKAYMEDAERGDFDKFKVSWKQQSRKTFDSAAFSAAHPEIDLSGYYKESSSRIFRVTESKGE